MYPIRVPALKIVQPLGEFYVVSLSAKVLLEVCHSVKAEILNDEDDESVGSIGKFVDRIKGTQRERKSDRLTSIREYSETIDACFPNAVILGANYSEQGVLSSKNDIRWNVDSGEDGTYFLNIPTKERLASIIDGQHRIFGFEGSSAQDMMLLCSVFIDLPMAFQAQVFTKINTTQKRVDKNLAYNLFQFDMAQGEPASWGPETLSVYFARVLAKETVSPFEGLLKLGVSGSSSESTISMASVIDGILALISSKPEVDRNALHMVAVGDGRDRALLENVDSKGPLRRLYLNNQDKTLFNVVVSFFNSVSRNFWQGSRTGEGIFKKTLGVQACFDFLKLVAMENGEGFDYSEDYFDGLLQKPSEINFSDDFFGVQSKVRARIKNCFLVGSGMKKVEDLRCSSSDKKRIEELLSS